ncbi:MAG: hypothetical protein AAB505_03010, partial [Patescibacteria group bacterium]
VTDTRFGFNYGENHPDLSVSYEVPPIENGIEMEMGGTDHLFLSEGLEDFLCLVGSSMQSRIGVNGRDSPPTAVIKEFVREGALLGSVLVDDRSCYLVRRVVVDAPGFCESDEDEDLKDYVRWDQLYIDQDGALMRWDTFVSNDLREIPSLQRRRDYDTVIKVKPSPKAISPLSVVSSN